MKLKTTSAHKAILIPETVEECGIMQFLAQRFCASAIVLKFDTTQHDTDETHPALFVLGETTSPLARELTQEEILAAQSAAPPR